MRNDAAVLDPPPAMPGRPALMPGVPALSVRMSEVLGALSYALDLTEGQPPGHSLRCCWIAMHIGQELRLGPAALSDLYYGTLLKDAGCSSNAARLWELYGGDERLTKQDFKTVDSDSLVQIGRFVLEHAGPGEALRERIVRVLNIARNGPALASELIQTRCERGANIVRRLGFGEAIAAGIYALDEHWNGKGRRGKTRFLGRPGPGGIRPPRRKTGTAFPCHHGGRGPTGHDRRSLRRGNRRQEQLHQRP